MKPVSFNVDEVLAPAPLPAWPVRIALTAWMFVVVAWLGVISLSWNLVAFLLRFVLRGATARRVGCAGISYGYRFYWACARASGLLRLEAESLDALRAVSYTHLTLPTKRIV